jgi:4'-phosphopantetheinyl transferase
MVPNVHWQHAPHAVAPTTRLLPMTAERWTPASPSEPPPLAAEAVHVWRVRLWASGGDADSWEVLSDDERRRAARLVHELHRRRFVAAHAMLRRILAGYTTSAARELEFSTGPHGKPVLVTSTGGSRGGVEFNLSHSADLALVAVARERPVGVDLERWERTTDHLALATRFFSPTERASLEALAARGDDLVHGFFAAWTRKEAYLKARGEGVMRGLHHFDVTLAPGEPARLLADRLDAAIDRWRMRSIEPGEEFSGAIVVADPFEDLLLLEPS